MKTLATCPSCGVELLGLHEMSCEVGRCRPHGEQLAYCLIDGTHAPTTYKGVYPGTEEAMARGWCYRIDAQGVAESCAPDDPDALPDLNRVTVELSWDPSTESYV